MKNIEVCIIDRTHIETERVTETHIYRGWKEKHYRKNKNERKTSKKIMIIACTIVPFMK